MKMIENNLVKKAVQILRDLNQKFYEDSSKKKPLLEDEEKSTVFLQVTLKKIPERKLIKMIKVPLPHSLLKDSDEVCLITGDLDKKNHKAEIEPDILHYKQVLESHNVNKISEVITLRQLRTDYKPYEAKQKLLAAYDVFLTDKKIAECLPRLLGKHFFKKRKFPIQIDMKSPNLKNQIEKALSTRVFHVTGHGNSCCSEVAHLEMNNSDIIENILEVTKILSQQLPGKFNNINGIYVKTSKSKSIPLYMSYESPNEIQFEESESETSEVENTDSEELEESEEEAKKFKTEKEKQEIEVIFSDFDLKKVEKVIKKPKTKKKEGEPDVVIIDVDEPEEETKNSRVMKKDTKKSKAKKKKGEPKVLISDLDELEKETKNSKSMKQKSFQTDSSLKKSKKDTMKKKNEVPMPLSGSALAEKGEKTKKFENRMKETLLDNCSVQADSEQDISQKPVKGNKKSKTNKKGLNEMENILPVCEVSNDKSPTEFQSKKKMKKLSSNIELDVKNKSKPPKRKYAESESSLADNDEAEIIFETQNQASKKRNVDGINMQRYNTRKISQKSKKKKENRSKPKF